MTVRDIAIRIEKIDRLDALGDPLGNAVKKMIPANRMAT